MNALAVWPMRRSCWRNNYSLESDLLVKLKPHQHDSFFLLETETFVKRRQDSFAGGNQVEAYNALRFEVIEALPEQAAGNPFPLVLWRDGQVVDFESPAIMEQHGSAQNEARHFSVHDTLQAVMLFAFKQFSDVGRGILH